MEGDQDDEVEGDQDDEVEGDQDDEEEESAAGDDPQTEIAGLKGKVHALQKRISFLKSAKRKHQAMENEDELLSHDQEDDEGQTEVERQPEATTVDDFDILMDDEDEEIDLSCFEENEDDTSDDENSTLQPTPTSRNEIRTEPGTRPSDEPKFIVFHSSLLSIFTLFCFNCKQDKPTVEVLRNGSMATVIQTCKNCGTNRSFKWRSQPFAFGKFPAGNIMMSFGILMSGISISQIFLAFRHMGLCAISPRTYFGHQKRFLFPSVLLHWEKYHNALYERVRSIKDVQWSGDGRFDSMGHNAKYGVYTMFCNSISKLVHFELLQANQTGSSNAMELEGAKLSFTNIKKAGLSITSFISDHHRGVAKWIREAQPATTHFHDLWHVCKGLTKKLLQASKETANEVIGDWIKGIRRHLFWCAMSTKQGFGELILSKWKSIMRHIADKHVQHPDTLFEECAHGDLEERDWIKIGTAQWDRLRKIVMDKQLMKDIEMLSSDAQTSCLEGFHSTLNHWHPKMTHYSWLGTNCRHIIAILHFNENLNRAKQKARDGRSYYNVIWPKYKMGEEVLREVPTVGQDYDIGQKINFLHLIPKPSNLKE